MVCIFFFQAEDGIRYWSVTGSSDVCSSDLIPISSYPNLCFDFCVVIVVVELYTNVRNTRARNLYQRLGYEEIGIDK